MSRCRDGYLREIDRQALEQGWRIEKLPGGHRRHVPPDRSKPGIVSASTPSDRRGTRNFVAALRRNGLVLPGRRQRAQDQGEQRETREFAHDEEIENMPTTNTQNTKEPLNGSHAPAPLADQQRPLTQPATFAEALRAARLRRPDTLQDVAEHLGTATHVVSAWEDGIVPVARYYDKLVELYSELAATDRPKRVRAATLSRRPALIEATPTPLPTRMVTASKADGTALPRGLRLIRDARRLREALVPILQGALEDGIGLSDLLEMLQ